MSIVCRTLHITVVEKGTKDSFINSVYIGTFSNIRKTVLLYEYLIIYLFFNVSAQQNFIARMSTADSLDIYYQLSWIKTAKDLVLNLFSSPQKTKRSLAEEAESGSVDGIKCWLSEGIDLITYKKNNLCYCLSKNRC